MIRMKVKTMAILLAILIFGAGIGYFTLPYLIYHTGNYDVLLKWLPKNDRLDSALILEAEAGMQFASSAGDEHIFIFPTSSSSSGQESTEQDRELAINKLQFLIQKYSTSQYINGVKFKLGKLYMWNKEWDKADQIFAELASVTNPVGFFPYEEMRTYQAMLNTRHVRPNHQASITGKVMIGGQPAADVFVVLHRKADNGWSSPPFMHYPVAITDEDGVYRFYNVEANDYEVGVGVMPAEVSGHYLTQSAREYVSIAAGKTETYDFHFVPQVTAVSPVNKEQIIGDKLRFEWEVYPGTDYYQLSITTIFWNKEGKRVGSSTVPLSEEQYTGTVAEYSLKELRGYSSGLSKSMESTGRVTLSNTGVLGAVFPGGDFIWSVDAFDANGRKISSSAGYYTALFQTTPFFTVSEEGMLEGDRFVIKGDYEQAIASYKSEGDNDHALRALSRLIYHGITKEDGDPAEALTYLLRISDPTDSDKDLIKQAQEKLGRK
jgi:5-hydroxyisourate hydrolase-like protein (transthyretin family)